MPTNRKFLVFASVAIIALSVFAFLWFKSLSSPDSRLEAEQEIYAVLFDNLIAPEDISQVQKYTLIDEFTAMGEGEFQTCTSKWCNQFISDGLPELNQNTFTDFVNNNKQPYSIKDYLSPTIGNLVGTPAEGKINYGWRLSFSRIGFNPFLTQALVLVRDCRGDACFKTTGESMYEIGAYFLLQKSEGKWVIQDDLRAWITELPSP